MILVDGRAGSCELVKPLQDWGLPVEETTLDFGDIAFLGRGEKGAKVFIGIEHKKVSDLVQSMGNGRLQDTQLQGMLEAYDRMWLIIEGEWSHDDKGRAASFRGGRSGGRRPIRGAPMAVALEQRILTLETRGGFRVRHCASRRDTLRFLCALYRFWTDKDLDEHKSHLAIHAPDLDRGMVPVSDFRRFVASIPGIGYRGSLFVDRYFQGDPERMMVAGVDEWAEITTVDDNGKERRIGTPRATRIYQFLHPRRKR
jgi:ERCC4-type nuclease